MGARAREAVVGHSGRPASRRAVCGYKRCRSARSGRDIGRSATFRRSALWGAGAPARTVSTGEWGSDGGEES